MGTVPRAIFRALKRKERQLAPNLDHLMQPKYVPAIIQRLSPKLQECLIRSTIAVSTAHSIEERREKFNNALKVEFYLKQPPTLGFEAMKFLDWVDGRLRSRRGDGPLVDLDQVPFKLQIGDVVVHNIQHHIGIVAERFAVNMMSDNWIEQNLAQWEVKARQLVLQAPWYTVLVDSRSMPQSPDFVRYGSELTHDLYTGGQADGIRHRRIAHLFSHYDPETRRYIPRYSENSRGLLYWLLRKDLGLPRDRVEALLEFGS